MTLAQQYRIQVEKNLECNEWFDGEDEIAQVANTNIAKANFSGLGFFRDNEVHFNDGSVVERYGITVRVK